MPIRIESLLPPSAPEPLLQQVHDLWCLWDLEYLPEDPPIPFAQRLVNLRWVRSDRHERFWLAWDGDDLVGISRLLIDLSNPKEKGCHASVFVHPEHRGKGHARALTAPVVSEAEGQGRTLISVEMSKDNPAAALVEGIGLKPVMQAKRSRLVVADVDRQLMHDWIERAAERASDYELTFFDGPIPEDALGKYVELMHVMNTAPMEDFEEEEHIFTAESWRENEANAEHFSERFFINIAVHEPTGAYVGYTSLNYQGNQPEQAWQWDTGVDPAHRNKGLGRWLKAATVMRLIEFFPEVERIDTYNAGSNEPMLNINIEMGYKPILIEKVYQGPVAAVRSWLDGA